MILKSLGYWTKGKKHSLKHLWFSDLTLTSESWWPSILLIFPEQNVFDGFCKSHLSNPHIRSFWASIEYICSCAWESMAEKFWSSEMFFPSADNFIETGTLWILYNQLFLGEGLVFLHAWIFFIFWENSGICSLFLYIWRV